MNHYRIIARQQLSEAEFAAVMQLRQVCGAHDQLTLKINPEMVQHRPGTATDDWLAYAGDTVIGFLGMYGFGRDEIELSGMVHPEQRRQGVFTALYRAARAEVERRGIGSMLWICPRASVSGTTFVQHIGAEYTFSEYYMRLHTAPTATALRPPLALRQSNAQDGAMLHRLMSDAFGMSDADTTSLNEKDQTQASRTMSIITLADEPIGAIGIQHHERGAYIYGFAIQPDQRGKGYGRQVLAHVTAQAAAAGYDPIDLEVATENANALHLYQSCGFREISVNDYYALAMAQNAAS